MKVKSLVLGSIALAGLATGAQAADLAKGALTSLDVCDALGLSGLTISSDTNCLQISGEVDYAFRWGDYRGTAPTNGPSQSPSASNPPSGADTYPGNSGTGKDWESNYIAYLQAVASSDSDFGPAKAVIKLKTEQDRNWVDGGSVVGGVFVPGVPSLGGNDTGSAVTLNEAYVSVGDTTVLSAGYGTSIVNSGDDTPLNYLGLFNSANADGFNRGGEDLASWGGETGVSATEYNYATHATSFAAPTGNHFISVVSSLGNGITLKGALEDLGNAGAAVGVISYAGDNLSAHVTVLQSSILGAAGVSGYTYYHGGLTASFDNVKLVGAIAGNTADPYGFGGFYNALVSAQVSLDMFKLAAGVEATHSALTGAQGLGYGLSATAAIADGVTLNLGGRYFDQATQVSGGEAYQIEGSLTAALTDTLSLTGAVGAYSYNDLSVGTVPGVAPVAGVTGWTTVPYGAASVLWQPGGGFKSSLKGEIFSGGGYRATFKATKAFQ